jgi:aryl-alcohol dehydrogenase-like predicted oxidoreductase
MNTKNPTKLKIPCIGLGTWSYGGEKWSHGWGPQPEELSTKTILEAISSGINLIDTAAVYGLGVAERVVGSSLIKWNGDLPFIISKCGQSWDVDGRFKTNLSKDAIRKGCIDSLVRLGVEVIDLMMLHYPSTISDENLSAIAELEKLKSEGKILNIGLSNFPLAEIQRAQENFQISAIQDHYSILHRQVESDLLPYCAKTNLVFIAYQPLDSGLLTGRFFFEKPPHLTSLDWRSRSKEFYPENINKLANLNAVLYRLASKYKVAISAISTAWVLSNPTVSSALVGMRNPKHVREILPSTVINITAEDKVDIDKALLRTDYPKY